MNSSSPLKLKIAELNADALFLGESADDAFYDKALVGYVERCGQPTLACYDADKCVECLMEGNGMSQEDALEFFEFNVSGSWLGPNTPVFMTRLTAEET